ncbi:TPA: baseplate protein [Enterobacter hormaechei subsp. xiangfangensis]|nr:baseplate protein [Enterobacter hormaechei subsp. xiangfangensis]
MKLTGKYKAIVGNTKHPDGLMMCQVKLVTLWDGLPEEALPWAEYQLAIGATFTPCKTGDIVWVEFPNDGDTRFPLITGAAMVSPGGTPNVPPEASGKGKPLQPTQVNGAPTVPAVAPGTGSVLRRNGLLEMRTNKGGIMFTHEKTGTRFGFNDNGELFFYAAKVMHFYSGGTMTFETAQGITFKTGADFAITSGAAFNVAAKTIELKAGQVAVKKG